MTTFDQIVPALTEMLRDQREALSRIGPLIVNRDLNGRVRLIVNEEVQSNPELMKHIRALTRQMAERLGRHTFPSDQAVLFDAHIDAIREELPGFTLEGLDNIWVVDRLVTESNWAAISPVAGGAPRVVFFSLKGGVGRSTAMAVSAWALAQEGYRVLALDLDLESPGLSSALLPEHRHPEYGITDWLVEDLVDNGGAVFEGMVAISSLSRDGDIYVVPAHGKDPGEYIPKLGRVWMPRVDPKGRREIWSLRLRRLIDNLEQRYRPDVILIDSRAGIDEAASACITDLGAHLALLFAVDSEQTWSGYRILFRHWRIAGVARAIRERLQVVGAMLPERDRVAYLERFRERAWILFVEELYDQVLPEADPMEPWSFDQADENAPHTPWAIRWHPEWMAIRSLHDHVSAIDAAGVDLIFGHLIDNLRVFISSQNQS
ncbi:MAG: ParA family protein [Roseiflexus sp.]|uniref:ParA family protein n=1 Tax=Roseiflexus sp. TaxID=2562120 RepID=UPI0025FF4141|nr:ParA family protein [Roseiflexus sp.]MCL6539162.1 ParA family protein [Roseiflexus sp.]